MSDIYTLKDPSQKAHEVFCNNLYDWTQHIIESNRDGADYDLGMLEKKLIDWSAMVGIVQSPIEEILGAGLLFASNGYEYLEFVSVPRNHVTEWGVVLEAQANVGKFKADFIITCHCHGLEKKIAIECDGHHYHEKTKKQAQKDKSRDRYFISKGIVMIRFTGSERYTNHSGCIDEIEGIVCDELEELMYRKGLIHNPPKRGRG